MIDIKQIRAEPERFKQAAINKRIGCDIDALCALDDQRKSLQQQLDQLKHQQNETGGMIAQYKNPKSQGYQRALAEGISDEQLKAEGAKLVEQMTALKAQGKDIEATYRNVADQFEAALLTVAQPPDEDVPVGKDDSENIELRRVSEPTRFDFEPKDHVTLLKDLGMLDLERGVKLAGSRNYVIRGEGIGLHQAVLRLATDMMVERGFVQMGVPVLVRDAMMVGTGYFPGGEEQAYRCERDELSLVGTAEVPLTSYHSDEVLSEDELPKKYVASSPCFRREAGAAGKDTYGLYRIHWFEKVEQVIVCRNDREASIAFHQEILGNAEAVLEALELPYRVMNVCTGELGQGQVQKFDIETWMPARERSGETYSASRFYEDQPRRLNLRYRDADKNLRFCHTLNNTVIASPRILIPLVENHQTKDGRIKLPPALRRYLGGREFIG